MVHAVSGSAQWCWVVCVCVHPLHLKHTHVCDCALCNCNKHTLSFVFLSSEAGLRRRASGLLRQSAVNVKHEEGKKRNADEINNMALRNLFIMKKKKQRQ